MRGALSITGLAVDLGGRRVLHNVTVAVEPGCLLGLVGPNGAGKTTLLRSVLGLLTPSAGTIEIDGDPPRRAALGYVPQHHEFAWDFPISVFGAVASGRADRLRGWLPVGRAVKDAAVAAIEAVGLERLRNRPVGELSGGQRQRVLLARALMRDPALLVLDEPFTGVDAPTQTALTEVLSSLTGRGHTVLMSTHDIEHARKACDRLLLLNRTVIAAGSQVDDQQLLAAFAGVST